MKNKLCLAIVFLVLFSNQAYSKNDKNQPEPSFYFNGFIPPKNKECIPSNKEDAPPFLNRDTCIREQYPYIKRNLNMSKKDLEEIFNTLIRYEDDDFNIFKKSLLGYDLITFESKISSSIVENYQAITKVTYILKNDIVIGYQIIDPLFISDHNNQNYTDSKIAIIKSLKARNQFNSKDLKINFYTKKKNDFIETYCLVDLSDTNENKYKNWFYVDSFYPKKLKQELMPLLEESLRYTFGITKFEYKDDDDEKDDD